MTWLHAGRGALIHVPLAIAGLLVASPSAAAGTRVEAGAGVLYGIWAGHEAEGINAYGFGLGANAGATLGFGLHLGAGFQYFLGGSETLPGESELSLAVRQALAVVGYEVRARPALVLRPELGLGIAWTLAENCQPSGCNSDSGRHFVLRPGVRLLYAPDWFHVAAEAAFNHVFVPIGNVDGVLIGAGAGVSF